jgi:pyruvate/2-oxoglutarate dehydrogenase complex dihydrolipoamide dehydrogenase (E3) component
MKYDCIVIGGGAAGLTAAKLAKGLGKSVAIVEKNKLGGDCTLTGCIPSKTLIKSSYVADAIADTKHFGLPARKPVTPDKRLFQHVRETVAAIYEHHSPEVLKKEGIDVIHGNAVFVDKHTVRIGAKTYTASKYIIASGSEPFIPPIPGLDSVPYLTNQNLFDLEVPPASLVILGGGPIGLEMACAFNHLGTDVTVIEMQDTILQKEDAEVASRLQEYLKEQGIHLRLGEKAEEVAEHADGIAITTVDKQEDRHGVFAENVLVAVGQHPVVAGMSLNNAGVSYSKQGIDVDDTMQTGQSNIYACGDVVGPYQFSHIANYQARIAARNAFVPLIKQHANYSDICWITYTDPECAHAGLTEKEARKMYGDTIKVYQKPYKNIDRAWTEADTRGFAKVVCDAKWNIIGIHILGASSGELMQELQVAKVFRIKLYDVYNVIHAYPAYSDIILHIAKDAYIDSIESNIFVRLYRKLFGTS